MIIDKDHTIKTRLLDVEFIVDNHILFNVNFPQKF